MAGGEPRLGTTATYMRRVNQRSAILCQPQIAMLHDRNHGKYQAFSAASLKTWSKFGLKSRVYGHPCTSLQSARARGAGALVRAADASLRDGGHAKAASQGREHQNSLRLPLYRDRAIAEAGLHQHQGILARGQAAGADRLRAHSIGV